MTPPISKDWWIAAALTSAALPTAFAQTASTPRAGVVSAITSSAPATTNAKTVMVGDNVVPGETLRTGPDGQLHVLFLDQSAVTLGADSELVIETFNYDPASRQGQIRLRLNQGLLRVVGGHISKTTATEIATAHGKVEIRGGITVVNSEANSTSGTFLFGQQMRATDNSGNSQTITRPGFGSSIGSQGVSTPSRTSPQQLNLLLSQLETRPNNVNQVNPNPSPAPSGQLLSTGNTPGGTTNPGNSLANDRLRNVVDTRETANPTQTLRNILGVGQTPVAS
ncbi:FecR domain-containing protein [Methyloversatilis discipulorum]|uniref:FecR family protein n=1 Tax=Methyloversatilis discipulorum TaxID=1119528 RepID=UPI000377FE73|nr:FecR domain-containing protein [Methyloversatilis discipulorum]